MNHDIYKKNGYENRQDYLKCLSEDHGVPLDVVLTLADTLGPSEDFDGLATAIEDAAIGL
ncbi:hypothetical protein ACMHYO_11475 [Allopusillimonas ginsengisoli]|uniref:hypothetical protein n=1 Tax=Allopusillimonas ginsengisoli TaxID=453575 RepID=UPI0039C1FBFD